jgi:hypothetical protein
MQPVRSSNGRNEEASPRYFAGWRVGRSGRASFRPVGEAWDRAPARSPERNNTVTLSGHFGAWRCHVKTTVIHSDRMKSHAVSAWSRASAIYKATPKGRVMRRIREAVSGSTDSWDGSRAVVADPFFFWGGRRNAKPFLSEQTRCGVDMGKLAARLKPPNGPPGPLSGNPAYPLRTSRNTRQVSSAAVS